MRTPNKLPALTARASYNLEYGSDALEIHRDAVSQGQEVLIVHGLLATGGTAAAVAQLIESLRGTVAGMGFLIELAFLKNRAKLCKYDLNAVLEY